MRIPYFKCRPGKGIYLLHVLHISLPRKTKEMSILVQCVMFSVVATLQPYQPLLHQWQLPPVKSDGLSM